MTEIVSILDEGLGNSSYVVDIGDRRALVLDPERDPGWYLASAVMAGRGRCWWIGVPAATLIVAAGVGVWPLLAGQDDAQDPMVDWAEQVMPFDLTRTTHTFTTTDDGGVETVVVNDPSDARNLALIRAHLAREAALVRTGDYSDPARIHGMDMPPHPPAGIRW